MHTYLIQKGTTNVSIELEIIDATDGTPETGVVYNTAGIDLDYRRDGAVSTAITEADLTTPALTDAHEDGGFLAIGNGVYRLDLPDAACAAGVDKVVIHGTVTGMVVIPCAIQLVDYDPFDAVRMGLTALPNAVADAAGGLVLSDAGGQDIDTIFSRITANVALASVCTEARLAELAAANMPTDLTVIIAYVDELETRLSAVRAGYLDNLSAGAVALAAALATAQTDLDTLTGADGATLATSQPNYAPNVVVPDAAGVAATEAEVLTQINAAFDAAISELGVAAPAVTPTMRTGLMWLYMMARNLGTQNSTTKTVSNGAGVTIASAAISDDATTFTKGEYS